jgi:hypothetical protein
MTLTAGVNSAMLPPKLLPHHSYIATSDTLQPPPKSAAGRLLEAEARKNGEPKAADGPRRGSLGSLGRALTDTPNSTAPSSPSLYVVTSF